MIVLVSSSTRVPVLSLVNLKAARDWARELPMQRPAYNNDAVYGRHHLVAVRPAKTRKK